MEIGYWKWIITNQDIYFVVIFSYIYIIAHTVSETTAQNKVFIYEPHLVSNLAELIHPTKQISNVMLLFNYYICLL